MIMDDEVIRYDRSATIVSWVSSNSSTLSQTQWSIKDFFSKYNNPEETKEIFNGKLNFLCCVLRFHKYHLPENLHLSAFTKFTDEKLPQKFKLRVRIPGRTSICRILSRIAIS